MNAQLARLVEHVARSFDMLVAIEFTAVQHLQAELLDLVRRARESDEQFARTFSDFMAEVSIRERARGR